MKTFIIAEAGVNHNGSRELAIQLIDAAAEAGADAVKFQTFKAERLVSRHAPKADYQRVTTDAEESQFDMLRRLELLPERHRELMNHCQRRGIAFLSTPFDIESMNFLVNELGLNTIKLPSGEVTNAPLLLAAGRSGVEVILSTGMADLDDIENALGVLAFGRLGGTQPPSMANFRAAWSSTEGQAALRGHVTLLHCTTEYPAPFDSVNLRAINTMAERFGLPVGFSDHTPGIAMPIAAVARGAVMVEKHFTLDRNLPGPDHQASLLPGELTEMVRAIRAVEIALGDGIKRPATCELANRAIVRKSLVATVAISKGEPFTAANVAVKRPGTGLSPLGYFDQLGKAAERNYAEDEVIG